jgi:hypothetical protein
MREALLLVATRGLAACPGMGPVNVTRDRFDCAEDVAESWKSQMLHNLAQIRYGGAPALTIPTTR